MEHHIPREGAGIQAWSESLSHCWKREIVVPGGGEYVLLRGEEGSSLSHLLWAVYIPKVSSKLKLLLPIPQGKRLG